MPTTTPDIKVKAVRRLGGTVELVGDSYTETQTHAQVPGRPGCTNPADPMPAWKVALYRLETRGKAGPDPQHSSTAQPRSCA